MSTQATSSAELELIRVTRESMPLLAEMQRQLLIDELEKDSVFSEMLKEVRLVESSEKESNSGIDEALLTRCLDALEDLRQKPYGLGIASVAQDLILDYLTGISSPDEIRKVVEATNRIFKIVLETGSIEPL